jgi:hypothetical protein
MKKIIIIFCLILTLSYSSQWENLLHFNNNQNQISSNEFYLSGNINATPQDELNATIKLLNSKQYGNIIACNFPARYTYLKENHYKIPDYNLSKCKKLNTFLDSFNKDRLSLVFSSEYTNNPSSAFGHAMILFGDDNKNINISDAVHFAAKTNSKDGFFKYSYNGFNGKYSGYFIREPFFKKIYEYNTLEQRYMYIYHLDFTKKQIRFLLYHLYELRKATFKYYFMKGNCATQTTDLLNVISGYERKNSVYYLPIDTIKQYKHHIIAKEKFIPLIDTLNLLIKKMTNKEKELFYKVIKTNSDINDNYPNIVKEALSKYTIFKFRKYHRWYKNYDSIMSQKYTKQNIKDNSPEPLSKTQPSEIGIGIYNQDKQNYLSLHYRPLFIDIFDIQLDKMQQSSVDTFTFDVILNNNITYLQKFDLINIKSFPSQNRFYKPISWEVYIGVNRDNKDNYLKLNNEIGIGRTQNIFNTIFLNTMINTGLDDNSIYLKPSIFLQTYYNKNIKMGIISFYKKYSNKKDYHNNTIFITIKNNNLLYQIKYDNDNSKNKDKILFSIKYNF